MTSQTSKGEFPFPDLVVLSQYLKSSIGKEFQCTTKEGTVKARLEHAYLQIDIGVSDDITLLLGFGEKLSVNGTVVDSLQRYIHVVTATCREVNWIHLHLQFADLSSEVIYDCPEIRSAVKVESWTPTWQKGRLNDGPIYKKSRFTKTLAEIILSMEEELTGDRVEDLLIIS